MIALFGGLLESSQCTDNAKPLALGAWALRGSWLFCHYMNVTMVLLRHFPELAHYCDNFFIGTALFRTKRIRWIREL